VSIETAGGPVDSQRFTFHATPLQGVWGVSRKPIIDNRGFFSRFYCAEEFAAIGLGKPLVQINHSLSRRRGTVRGMHFQNPPHAETKVITCMAGVVFDVAVDLRHDSPTFLQWFGLELSAQNQRSLVIPPGFAHGYQTMTDDAEILYLVTTPYTATSEDGFNPFDPAIGIRWPAPVSDVSSRDADRTHIDLLSYRGLEITNLDTAHG
jgi:dTDP-4-dehydrorhamnose 3,5-epimerase